MKYLSKTLAHLAGRIAVRCGAARVVRRFSTDEQGTTAVEFGLVAVPFIALMMAILETALVFFAGQVLETSVSNAGRLIRTGQAQQLGLTAATFKDMICQQIYYLFDCAGGIRVEVKKYDSFAEIDLSRPTNGAGNLKIGAPGTPNDLGYDPGHGGDIVLVRAFYEWPTFVTLLGNNMGDLADGNHLLAGTTAFRNEPFPW
jgi:Flp pilus assembly protein TadG